MAVNNAHIFFFLIGAVSDVRVEDNRGVRPVPSGGDNTTVNTYGEETLPGPMWPPDASQGAGMFFENMVLLKIKDRKSVFSFFSLLFLGYKEMKIGLMKRALSYSLKMPLLNWNI